MLTWKSGGRHLAQYPADPLPSALVAPRSLQQTTSANLSSDVERTEQDARLDVERTEQNARLDVERTEQNARLDVERTEQNMSSDTSGLGKKSIEQIKFFFLIFQWFPGHFCA